MTAIDEMGARSLKARVPITAKTTLLIAAFFLGGLSAFADDTPPSITQSPQSQVVTAGADVTLSVMATGTSLQYQWTCNGNILPGATSPTLALNNVTADNSGAYRVIVVNSAGLVTSVAADVQVMASALPFADNFADRGIINTASGIGSGTSVGAAKQSGDPQPYPGPIGYTVWLTWVAPADGIAIFNTIGSTFDTVLGIYTGTNLSSLVQVAADDESGGNHTSYVTFNAQAGTAYQIFVGSRNPVGGGAILLQWQLAGAEFSLPTILSLPTNVTTTPGASASLCVQYQSSTSLTVQWYHNGVAIPGANQTCLLRSQLTVDDLGSYQASLASPQWTWFLEPVEIQFNSEGISTVGARKKLFDSIDSPLIGH
jgi:hypothetical protein